MRIVGTIDADLLDATEYKEGGIGPLFGETRVRESLSVEQLLHRLTKALQRLDGVNVVSLFIDEEEVYRDFETREPNIEDVLALARDALAELDEPEFLELSVACGDEQLEHLIFIEASTDHDVEDAAIYVLDTAEVVGDEDGESREEEPVEPEEDLTFASDAEARDTEYVDESDYEALLESFLEKLLAAFEKELQLVEPEIDVWTDYTGEYDPVRMWEAATSRVMPDVPYA